jgi:hypothetical protein
MSESDFKSNILSNFMIFSKNAKRGISTTTTEAVSSKILSAFNSSTYTAFVICVIIVFIILAIYYQKDGEYDWMPNINFEKLWLSTHLNSAGELASTYVPKNFLQTSGDDVLTSLQI